MQYLWDTYTILSKSVCYKKSLWKSKTSDCICANQREILKRRKFHVFLASCNILCSIERPHPCLLMWMFFTSLDSKIFRISVISKVYDTDIQLVTLFKTSWDIYILYSGYSMKYQNILCRCYCYFDKSCAIERKHIHELFESFITKGFEYKNPQGCPTLLHKLLNLSYIYIFLSIFCRKIKAR